MRRIIVIVAAFFLGIVITACDKVEDTGISYSTPDDSLAQSSIGKTAEIDSPDILKDESETPQADEEEEDSDMIMEIGYTQVQVVWEDNEAVEALKELVSQEPLSIQMSMYGGFEQVGSIGQSLPGNDKQITTEAGDIVLYSGNQIVVFYGSNTWAYTRLGSISDKSEKELSELLGNGNVTITIKRLIK